jgi:hypothetical protein
MTLGQISLLIGFCIVSLRCYGQNAKTAIDIARDRNCESVRTAANHVSEKEPTIDRVIVHRDLKTLIDAQKRIKQVYAERGFDDCTSMQVTALAWKELRMNQPRGKLNEDSLVKLANDGFGGLKIISVPAGAAIKVDGKQWDQPTNTASWTHVGKRKIELLLQGYEDSEGVKEVIAGAAVEYRAKLEKKK